MVKATVKVNLSLNELFTDITRGVARSRALKDTIEDEIIASIESGVSPVKGEGPFTQYKVSTAKKKGRTLPVNLRDSGKLHKSLKVTGGRDGLEIRFDSDYAHFHQDGTTRMAQRMLLPEGNKEFKTSIMRNIISRMQDIVNAAVNKQNRS